MIVRTALAAREGQLALDFRPAPSDASGARRHLERKPPPTTSLGQQRASAIDPHAALAAEYFLEGRRSTSGCRPRRQDQAAAACRRALIIDPELVPAIVNLANIHYARDELIEAEALYERAITLDGGAEAHFNLRNIHHDLSRYRRGGRLLPGSGHAQPGYADAHFYLTVTLEKMGQSSRPSRTGRRHQRLAPNGEWVELGGGRGGPGGGRRDTDDRRLAGAGRRQIGAVEQHDLDRRHVAEARHAILLERAVEDPAAGELDRLEQRAAESLHDGPFDLVLQAVGVDDRAALERDDEPLDLEPAGRARHFRRRRDVAAFLGAARDAERPALLDAGLASRFDRAASSTARIRASFRCAQAELERVQPSARAISSMCISRA